MGFLNLFKTGKKFADGKADQAAQAIEDKDPILFAEQDLKQIKDELKVAQDNVAKMTATKMQIEREMKDLKAERAHRAEQGSKVKALVESGDEGKKATLMKIVGRIKDLDEELAPLQASLDNTQKHLDAHEKNTAKLKKAVDDADRDLRSMKAMEQVTKSTEALQDVSTGNADSALTKMKDRKKKQQMRLDEANAKLEVQNAGDDLDGDIDAALGNSAENDILSSL